MESAYETLQVEVKTVIFLLFIFISCFDLRQLQSLAIPNSCIKRWQDAAGLTQLSSTVEDVFATGDLPRVAETLANMRHCLSAVGEVMCTDLILIVICFTTTFVGVSLISNCKFQVAEFANVRKQLEVLEDRLDSMVQPRLTDALASRKVVFLTIYGITCIPGFHQILKFPLLLFLFL